MCFNQIHRTGPFHPAALPMGSLPDRRRTTSEFPGTVLPEKVPRHRGGAPALPRQSGVPGRGVGALCLAEAERWPGKAGNSGRRVWSLSIPELSH